MIIHKEVSFSNSPKKVWELITNPELTKQYMFGSEVLSEWKLGSPITWEGIAEDGKTIVYVKGTITEIEAGEKVSFTMIDPNSDIPDIPSNYVNLTYEVSPQNQGTLLTITQGDFQGAENGQKRYEESLGGWDMVIGLMKGILD